MALSLRACDCSGYAWLSVSYPIPIPGRVLAVHFLPTCDQQYNMRAVSVISCIVWSLQWFVCGYF